jgi:hypothetical protein
VTPDDVGHSEQTPAKRPRAAADVGHSEQIEAERPRVRRRQDPGSFTASDIARAHRRNTRDVRLDRR